MSPNEDSALVAREGQPSYTPGVPPSAGDEIAGRYRLVRRIGAGGMGEVWTAQHLALELEMAVKLIAPGRVGSEKAERRFRREAQAAAKVKSPFIATIHDFGRSGGHLFLVMELLEGRDLSAYLESGAMAPAQALFVLDQLCRALAVIHDAAIVHRDIKPSNIFLSEHGSELTTKLLDFGVAKTLDVEGQSVTQTTEVGVRVGSPAYMSPEQVFGDEVTPQSDLWSLACVAYEMLAGQLPFYGAVASRRYPEIVAGNVRPLELEGVDSTALLDFFRQSLSALPEDRPATARHFYEGLHEVLGAPEPVMPRRLRRRKSSSATATITLPPGEAETHASETDDEVDPPSPVAATRTDDPVVPVVSSPWRGRVGWAMGLGAGVVLAFAVSRRPSSSLRVAAPTLPALPTVAQADSSETPEAAAGAPVPTAAPAPTTTAPAEPAKVVPVPPNNPPAPKKPNVDPFSGLPLP